MRAASGGVSSAMIASGRIMFGILGIAMIAAFAEIAR
jgi:hypothetical protein